MPSHPAATFDAAYYLATYPDVARSAEYGTLERAQDHFNDHGMKEGRTPNFLYDPHFYQAMYPDIPSFFGRNKWEDFYNHWLKYGLSEGRRGALFFDPVFYMRRHPDLMDAFGQDNWKAGLEHWLSHGIDETRRSIPDINAAVLAPTATGGLSGPGRKWINDIKAGTAQAPAPGDLPRGIPVVSTVIHIPKNVLIDCDSFKQLGQESPEIRHLWEVVIQNCKNANRRTIERSTGNFPGGPHWDGHVDGDGTLDLPGRDPDYTVA